HVSDKMIESPEFCLCDWFNNLNIYTSVPTTCKLPRSLHESNDFIVLLACSD
ncbi:hypothetical protein ZWY2020_014280, partial [Hordeum vulgare]